MILRFCTISKLNSLFIMYYFVMLERLSNSQPRRRGRDMSGAGAYVVRISDYLAVVQQCPVNLVLIKAWRRVSLREEARGLLQAPDRIRHIARVWKRLPSREDGRAQVRSAGDAWTYWNDRDLSLLNWSIFIFWLEDSDDLHSFHFLRLKLGLLVLAYGPHLVSRPRPRSLLFGSHIEF